MHTISVLKIFSVLVSVWVLLISIISVSVWVSVTGISLDSSIQVLYNYVSQTNAPKGFFSILYMHPQLFTSGSPFNVSLIETNYHNRNRNRNTNTLFYRTAFVGGSFLRKTTAAHSSNWKMGFTHRKYSDRIFIYGRSNADWISTHRLR